MGSAEGPRGAEIVIDIQVVGLAAEEGDYIARCLRQQVYVQSVLTSVKEAAPAARSAWPRVAINCNCVAFAIEAG